MTLSDINSTSRRTGCFIQPNAGCLVFVAGDLFEEMFSSAWCVLTGLLGYETLHTRDDVEIKLVLSSFCCSYLISHSRLAHVLRS